MMNTKHSVTMHLTAACLLALAACGDSSTDSGGAGTGSGAAGSSSAGQSGGVSGRVAAGSGAAGNAVTAGTGSAGRAGTSAAAGGSGGAGGASASAGEATVTFSSLASGGAAAGSGGSGAAGSGSSGAGGSGSGGAGGAGAAQTITGTATFQASGAGVELVVAVTGCSDAKTYPIHIHEGTSCESTATQMGHWDVPRGEGIPNVTCANGKGSVTYTRPATDATLAWKIGGGGEDDILGHVMVIHDNDAAGTRLSCGKIEQ